MAKFCDLHQSTMGVRYPFMQNVKFLFSLTGVCCLFLFAGWLQAAEGVIEGVHFYEKAGDSESVTFHLNGPYLPTVFAMKGSNPRVVFDFNGTKLARTAPVSIETGGSMILQVRLGRHPGKTRAVLDLVPNGNFNFEQTFDEIKNILIIEVFPADLSVKQEKNSAVAVEQQEEVVAHVADGEAVAEAVNEVEVENAAEAVAEEDMIETAPAPVPAQELTAADTDTAGKDVMETEAENVPSPDPLLASVSFENTSNKGEMVLFKLNGFYPPVVRGEEEGTPKVICEFAGARLAESVVKEQASGGEYISHVRVEQLDDADLVRVTLDLVVNKNYDLQQVFFKEDNLFVVIVNSYDAIGDSVEGKK